MQTVEIETSDSGCREFFRGEFVKSLLGEVAESAADRANSHAHAVMHTPSIDPYVSGVRLARECAIGVVYAKTLIGATNSSLGVALDEKYGCLRASVK